MVGGPSGFPRRAESEYDTFGTAHSSTSISAALGMAIAAKRKGEDRARRRGDRRRRDERRHGVRGAEQRRHRRRRPARHPQRQRHVDLASRSARSTTTSRSSCASRLYNTVRRGGKEVLSKLPPVQGARASAAEEHMKGMVLPGTLFEEFGFNYIGPIDGHDVDALVPTLANVKRAARARSSCTCHEEGLRLRRAPRRTRSSITASRKFDPAVGIVPKAGAKPTYTQIFGDWLCDMAAARPAPRRHHAGDARRLGARALLAGVSRRATSTSASPSSTR